MISRFWSSPLRLNQAAALSGNVSIGAPLIAVAELTIIVTVLTQEKSPSLMPLVGQAIALMCASVVCMVFSVQYGFWAVSYWNTPEEQLAWHPTARASLKQLNIQRVKMANAQHLYRVIGVIAEGLFRIGVVFFLGGLACLLDPPSTATPDPATLPHDVDVSDWRNCAMWIAFCALVLEGLWVSTSILARGLARIHEWLERDEPHLPWWWKVLISATKISADLMWFVSKPFFPDKWNGPYIPLDRPEVATVQALLDRTGELPLDLASELERQPREWSRGYVNWKEDKSSIVSLKGKMTPEGGWVEWPWGVFADHLDVTVVHPFGVVQGTVSAVRDRLERVERHLSERRRDRRHLERLNEVLGHLQHLEAGNLTPGCRICGTDDLSA